MLIKLISFLTVLLYSRETGPIVRRVNGTFAMGEERGEGAVHSLVTSTSPSDWTGKRRKRGRLAAGVRKRGQISYVYAFLSAALIALLLRSAARNK